jgi:hypothetical protein
MKLDDRDIDQMLAREEQGIRHGYRATALSAHYKTGMQRDSTDKYSPFWNTLLTYLERKHQRDTLPEDDDDSAEDAEEALLFQGSSSGYMRPRATSKRQRSTAIRSQSGSRAPSSSPASTPTSASQQLGISFQTPSVDLSLQRQAVQVNLDAQAKRTELELREKEADVKRLELENMKLELELEAMRKNLAS